MFIFGHIGITLGIVYSITYLLERLLPEKMPGIDYRWVALGSLFPDMIDKPLGRIFLAETIGSGRIIAHTLLFGLCLLLPALYLYRKKQLPTPLVFAGASFCHLLEDSMWKSPTVLLWPLLGWDFPKDTIPGNFFEYLMVVFSHAYDPAFAGVFASELLGLGITLAFAANYIKLKMEKKES